MRILHVIAGLAPRYGGPSAACPALCRELVRRGVGVTIYTTNVDGPGTLDVPLDHPVVQNGVTIHFFPYLCFPRRYIISIPLLRALQETICEFDVVHIYSPFMFSSTAAGHYCQKFNVPYVLHPHGTLDPYLRRRHRLRKWIYSILFGRRTLRSAAAILFNSEEERRLAANAPGLRFLASPGPGKPKPAVIYVGVEDIWFRDLPREARERFRRQYPELVGRRLVTYVGRLNFKKGLDLLVQGFARVAEQRPEAHLVLVGPDSDGYEARVRGWLRDAGVLDRTTFTGVLAGEDLIAAAQEAEVFVLPSYSENFGQAVAEAMACGIPVIISDRVNIWPEVQRAGAGLVVRCDARETAQALHTILDNPALGREMGRRGRQLAREKMSWEVVGKQMLRLYHELARDRPVRDRAGRKPCESVG